MEQVKDLFNISRFLTPRGVMDERAGCIKFFEQEKFKHENGTVFTGKDLGIRCAHLKLDHLYAIKSVYEDIKRRQGYDKASKYFMGATKTVKV